MSTAQSVFAVPPEMRRHLVRTFLNLIHRVICEEGGTAIAQYVLLFALIAVITASATLRLLPDLQSGLHGWLFEVFDMTVSR
jgi:hypothetical protein